MLYFHSCATFTINYTGTHYLSTTCYQMKPFSLVLIIPYCYIKGVKVDSLDSGHISRIFGLHFYTEVVGTWWPSLFRSMILAVMGLTTWFNFRKQEILHLENYN